jgi:hypothetical protein
MLRSPLINKLAFPGGRMPMINMNHRAASGYGPSNSSQTYRFGGIALVATNSGMMSIVGDPNPGTAQSTGISYAKYGVMGPAVKCSDFTSALQFTKGAGDGSGRPSITAAILCVPNFSNGRPGQIIIGCGARGFAISDTQYNAGGFLSFYWDSVTLDSSTARIQAGVPYFVLSVSQSTSGNGFYLAKNLLTGQVSLDPSHGGQWDLSDTATGTFNLFNTSNLLNGLIGYISAFMWMQSPFGMGYVMTIQEGLDWADDPWSFWYPDPFEMFHNDTFIVGSAAAAAGRPNRLPLLGVG